ncbi:MAG: protease modulator HflC [Synergistaceae bacterium]|nr:protease modulator HflC [Synergistaceae bacterium]
MNMTMKQFIIKAALIVIAVIILLTLPFSFYVVGPNEYAALFKFGKIVSVTDEPGIKFKVPQVHSVRYISKKLHLYDIPRSGVITKDKKSMIADNYVTWRVTDPVKYIQTLNANESRARERIEAAVYNAVKNVISSMTQDEVIEARGGKLSTKIAGDSNSDIGMYGIAIVQTEIKALDLPNDNKAAVYERMISERQNIAASYTAEGKSEAQKIRNRTDRETAIKIANASQSSDILIAEGEAGYMKILQTAYDTPEKAEFYNFLRSLDSLRKSFATDKDNAEKIIILDKNSEIGKLIYGNQ